VYKSERSPINGTSKPPRGIGPKYCFGIGTVGSPNVNSGAPADPSASSIASKTLETKPVYVPSADEKAMWYNEWLQEKENKLYELHKLKARSLFKNSTGDGKQLHESNMNKNNVVARGKFPKAFQKFNPNDVVIGLSGTRYPISGFKTCHPSLSVRQRSFKPFNPSSPVSPDGDNTAPPTFEGRPHESEIKHSVQMGGNEFELSSSSYSIDNYLVISSL